MKIKEKKRLLVELGFVPYMRKQFHNGIGAG
jgi:hypothetical protein